MRAEAVRERNRAPSGQATKVTRSRCVAGVRRSIPARTALVHAQMPDPRQMSGIPRPVTDLPDRSISVRVIRGSLTNNIPKQPVELHVGSSVQTVNTDAQGRAQFDNVPAGASVKAVALVDGARLESQEFPAPAQGGIRLLLVATDKTGAAGDGKPAAPAVSGQVAIAGRSRFMIEPGEEVVEVYYLLDIINSGATPVNPEGPFVFDVPDGAVGTAVLEGSSPQATVKGKVTVDGPRARFDAGAGGVRATGVGRSGDGLAAVSRLA